ncbi:hypothetical protein J1N35_044256 [Gossypium stocksii]|uniref:Uncharacterized protein n=1 Tax=Gossypium stocksii TaxID=47602 RepID=A0A9D3U8X1_9ROSI|nr:hypothetical protein J1N35_044256 [Gossypium stocksii]
MEQKLRELEFESKDILKLSAEEFYLDGLNEVRNKWWNGRMGRLLRDFKGVLSRHGMVSTSSPEQHYEYGLSTLWSDTAIVVRSFKVTL